jgi:ABC-2 type transport system ATP-binding protein
MIAQAPMVELRNLVRTFGDTRAVDNVSFAVGRGQVFGYIGPNGAGKTTSMRILATIDLPTQGDAFVDGFSVIDDPDRVRRRLGFMPDYFGTYPNMNVADYLDFFARAYGLRGSERTKALSYVMDFTQLDRLATKPITGLSKGMKQRLCLGRTMVHNPAVMILDEPAAGLDPRARIELREMIRRLAADGKTILISSHILSELAEMVDTIGIIEQGRMLAVGTMAEIHQLHKTESEVRVRVLADPEGLAHWLSANTTVMQIRIDGEHLTFAHAGDEQTEADLLQQMVGAGFRVAAFGGTRKSLEDVFLKVTQGVVQ